MRMRNPKYKDEIIASCEYLITDEINFEDNSRPLHIEIGMGKGAFILQMALNNPNINFIGIEKYSSVAALAIKKLNEYKLPNLKIIISDVVNLAELFKNNVDTIYLNFSDPWPKDRHAKRRLTHENFLQLYDGFFKNEAIIIQKTDNVALFDFSLESLKNYGYEIIECSRDLHNTKLPNYMTEYEKKFSDKGIKINYLKARKNLQD